ncbi:DUF262 domain-containing protein [Hyphomonas chukchiensis]|uniref:DUF262 domain-containing protein n=1 Tax=Hyphomonas chukchiensis TaxID=1280947 RepID=A0A062UFF9_9PROT|nr:DUF262 domain-containing protein [Hyphomonas chukchiensis]KCZ56453.1 hypothetical protein HY30_18650 [Hyphomonas chukchiensis]
MQAKDYSLNTVLRERQQWVIPVYQRHFAWETKADKQLPKLWDDVRDRALERLEGKEVAPHFVGAIIYSEPTDQPFGTVNRRHLVDGQQRISTFSLVLCAVREIAEAKGEMQLASAAKAYIFNEIGDAMADPERERFKLWSSSHDRPHYLSIADGGLPLLRSEFSQFFYKNGKLVVSQAPKMLAAYWYLTNEIEAFVEEQIEQDRTAQQALDAILHGFLHGFQIVVVQLGKQDDAQSIFASLNGNAEPLSAFDLIRNDIFHRASKAFENEDALYQGSWSRLETQFWKTEVKQGRLKRPRTDHLVAHTLVAETAQEINVGQVANEYRAFAKANNFDTVEAEITSLLEYADVYETLERRSEHLPEARIASLLTAWDMSAFHPLVMWIGKHEPSEEAKRRAYTLLESYIVRRDLCNLTRKNYNKVVPSLLRAAKAADDVPAALLDQMNTFEGDISRLPHDEDVKRAVLTQPVYDTLGSLKLRYLLREIEMAARGKFEEDVTVKTDNLTVEHIMPQKWAEHWPLPNGTQCAHEISWMASLAGEQLASEVTEAMDRREQLKHTLGNLTLVTGSLNPAMGKAGWVAKKRYLTRSLLTLNQGVCAEESWWDWGLNDPLPTAWNETVIEARSRFLAEQIIQIWHVSTA